jgi:hypothetical protein
LCIPILRGSDLRGSSSYNPHRAHGLKNQPVANVPYYDLAPDGRLLTLSLHEPTQPTRLAVLVGWRVQDETASGPR